MDLRRLRAGDLIAAAAGVALLASLFAPWYGKPGGEPAGTAVSAWAALGVIDIVLALVAAAAILVAAVTAAQRTPAVPIAYEAVLTLAGLVALVLVAYRVLDTPGGASGREWGLWLGLAGALGVVVGAALAMRDERLSPPGRNLDLTGRPTPPPPEIEVIPAPRPEAGA